MMLYKKVMHHAWLPYHRLRRGSVLIVAAVLLLFFLSFSLLSWKTLDPPHVATKSTDIVLPRPVDNPTTVAKDEGVDIDVDLKFEDNKEMKEKEVLTSPETRTQAPFVLRLLLPLIAGFCFGFLGSVPVAGPTSAMVLKLGIQGKYRAGLTIAVGGAISEATYAGIAFWGFGSFLAGAKFLLPTSKVLGAIMFTLIGLIFLKADMKPSLDPDVEASHGKGVRRPQGEVLRNILVGLTMSGINPALLASYTGAIASVYGTGMLEFTLFLAFVFAIGVCSGVSTWFYLLLFLLKKYKQRLQSHTIDLIMRGLGCFLLTLGLLCAKSSLDYFLLAPPNA
ncbi:lysine exporter protein (lyse ygga) [Plasmopara halstedii]|uniref:Lysine exporter protein (Lyse ygga) n=1 Tax=Plasmopara halstedii TaxID=4781 RepID=A0A0P1AAA0_PLAHL|nr:lysine exporter protein (lyse ygga) [Plasmopara halstedii]CEG37513.1 lysine exporter protein (lyse ygga) [Plasmopara halstedii]|eukprot:XP_024573882.1 lysine exporter protein (lyse ygga) [Plasmopara halstedii]